MIKLTPEQIKTLEDAFDGYPEGYPKTPKYTTMEGIQEQLDELNGNPGYIVYISKAEMTEEDTVGFFRMENMEVGETSSDVTAESVNP